MKKLNAHKVLFVTILLWILCSVSMFLCYGLGIGIIMTIIGAVAFGLVYYKFEGKLFNIPYVVEKNMCLRCGFNEPKENNIICKECYEHLEQQYLESET